MSGNNRMMQLVMAVLLVFTISSTAEALAFQPSSTSRSASTESSAQTLAEAKQQSVSTRRAFFNRSVATAAAAALISHPTAARADELTYRLKSPASLRSVKRASKQLNKLEAVVYLEDYAQLKDGLRTSPLGEIRKNLSTITKGYDDDVPELQSLYATFIFNLERVDSLTGQTIRGRKDLQEGIAEAFKTACATLETFIQTAEPIVDPLTVNGV